MRATSFLIFLGLFFFIHNVSAQEITIIDKLTQQRIPGVKVYSNSPKIQKIADQEGRFQLSDFMGADSIYVSYTNYRIEVYTYNDLKSKVWIELTEDHLPISEMVVSGNRWDKDKSKIPHRITKLNLRELELLGPQTSADLLENSGYVFVQRSQLAGGSPQLRGFGTNRVMIVVDGVRMNNAIYRSGNIQNVISLDANSLESAEVLFGPGAVNFGSGAIGGVMDFNTKKVRYTTDTLKPYIKTNLFSRYSSVNNEKIGHLDFNFGAKKWAFLSTITYSKFGDLRAGSNGDSAFLRPTYQGGTSESPQTLVNDDPTLQVHSGYDQVNTIQKIQFKPNEKNEFVAALNYSQSSDAPRYDRLIQDSDNNDTLDYVEWYYGPQKWLMGRLSWSNSHSNLFYDQFNIVAAYQDFSESRHDRKYGKSYMRRQFENVKIGSLNADFEKEIGSRSLFTYGGEYIYNLVNSHAFRDSLMGDQLEINSRYPDGSTWQSYGIYGNIEYNLNDKWSMHSGLRYSHYMINAQFDTTLFAYPITSVKNANGALNGSVGIVYNPTKNGQYYINASTGYRAPNIDDIGKIFDSEQGLVVVPNVDLKPENALNVEVGFMQIVKGLLKIDGAAYYTFLKDALARGDFLFNGEDSIYYEGTLSRVQAIQNLSDAYVYGFQAGIDVVLYKGLSLSSTINYQKGEELSLDSNAYFPIQHIAPFFGRSSLKYKGRQFQLQFYAVYHGEMSSEDLPLGERDDLVYAKDGNGENYVPAWYTINFKGSYFFNKHLSVNVGIENITDQLYRTYGSGISAPGRNFTASLKASF